MNPAMCVKTTVSGCAGSSRTSSGTRTESTGCSTKGDDGIEAHGAHARTAAIAIASASGPDARGLTIGSASPARR